MKIKTVITHIFLGVTLSHTPLLSGETLTITADEWYPMNGQPESDKPGYMIEMATEIFKPHNIQINYKLTPWERAVKQTRAGTYNCIIGTYQSDAPDFLFPEQHWGWDTPTFFTKKEDPWYYSGSIDSLNNRKLGLIQGYSYFEALDKHSKLNEGLHFQFAKGKSGLKTNIKKIMAGRIDTLIESESVLKAKLNDMGLKNTLKMAGNSASSRMYIACSPKLATSKKYINIINKGFDTLLESGRLKEILAKYGLPMWDTF